MAKLESLVEKLFAETEGGKAYKAMEKLRKLPEGRPALLRYAREGHGRNRLPGVP